MLTHNVHVALMKAQIILLQNGVVEKVVPDLLYLAMIYDSFKFHRTRQAGQDINISNRHTKGYACLMGEKIDFLSHFTQYYCHTDGFDIGFFYHNLYKYDDDDDDEIRLSF